MKTTRRKIAQLTVFLIGIFIIVSCGQNTVYKKYKEITSGIWEQSFQPSFEFEIEDSSQLTQINVMVRNASLYPYRNLWLFIHQTSPDGTVKTDTLECILADKNGKWLGDGMGDLWDNEIPWRFNYQFPETGTYHYEVEHGMRNDIVPGIMDIGLSIKIQE
ncbi:MAG: gliding motility lipoprotein GldH [Bacteroidota bacterium]|nr:gliding motility lipoprotein GldH [Bacteroidota bacterium]